MRSSWWSRRREAGRERLLPARVLLYAALLPLILRFRKLPDLPAWVEPAGALPPPPAARLGSRGVRLKQVVVEAVVVPIAPGLLDGSDVAVDARREGPACILVAVAVGRQVESPFALGRKLFVRPNQKDRRVRVLTDGTDQRAFGCARER